MWLVFLLIAFLLGTVRELLITPWIGQRDGRIIGTVVTTAAMLAVMAVFVRRVRGSRQAGDFWLIGAMWMVMTVAFELLFFHFVAGEPWHRVLADYNILRGRTWVLIPLLLLLGPPILRQLMIGSDATRDRPRG